MAATEKRRTLRHELLLSTFLLAALGSSTGQVIALPGWPQGGQAKSGRSDTEALLRVLQVRSFPELAEVDFGVRPFHSQADYFRTRFSISRFLFLQRMRYFVEVNPALFSEYVPSDGVCAVLAHELSHVVSLNHGNRVRRLSLIRLLSKSYTAGFERKTDLEAIHRGYGDGLKSYRVWVYAHIPAGAIPTKRRNYFSPEEIEAIQRRLRERPDLFGYWSKRIPRNLQEILKNPG